MAEPNVHRHIFLLQNGSCRMVYESCSTCIRLHPLVRTGPLQNGRGREKAIKRIPQGSLDSRQQQQQQPTQPPTTSKSPGPTRPQSRVTSHLSFFRAFSLLDLRRGNGHVVNFVIKQYFICIFWFCRQCTNNYYTKNLKLSKKTIYAKKEKDNEAIFEFVWISHIFDFVIFH